MGKYRDQWTHYDVNAKDKAGAEKPVPPDFSDLARKYKMAAGTTGLVSQFDLADTDLGKSENYQQRKSVAQITFETTTLYRPDDSDFHPSDDSDESSGFPKMKRIHFVFWKTDDQPDHIPKWEDSGVQDEVLRVWKLTEARKLAQSAADDLKAESQKKENAGKSLKELPAGKRKDCTVLEPRPFSSLRQMFGQLQLGVGFDSEQKAFGLEKVGVPFMEKVFSIAANHVDVATNQPKTKIYVIRPIKFTPFKELWSDFMEDAENWTIYRRPTPNEMTDPTAGLRLMIAEQQGRVSQAWLEKVKADAGLEWKKRADRQHPAPSQSPGQSPLDED